MLQDIKPSMNGVNISRHHVVRVIINWYFTSIEIICVLKTASSRNQALSISTQDVTGSRSCHEAIVRKILGFGKLQEKDYEWDDKNNAGCCRNGNPVHYFNNSNCYEVLSHLASSEAWGWRYLARKAVWKRAIAFNTYRPSPTVTVLYPACPILR